MCTFSALKLSHCLEKFSVAQTTTIQWLKLYMYMCSIIRKMKLFCIVSFYCILKKIKKTIQTIYDEYFINFRQISDEFEGEM